MTVSSFFILFSASEPCDALAEPLIFEKRKRKFQIKSLDQIDMTVASVLPECLTIPVRKKTVFCILLFLTSRKSSIYNVRYIFIDAPVKIKINLYVRSISRIDDVKMVIKCIQNLLHVFLDVSNLKTVFLQPKLIFIP